MRRHSVLPLLVLAAGACGDASAPAGSPSAVPKRERPAPTLEVPRATHAYMLDQVAVTGLAASASVLPRGISTPAPSDPTMLIRTGTASIEVANLDSATARVRAIAAGASGYITDVSVTGGRDEVRTATLTVKVPATRYDDVVRALRGLGTIESVQTQVEDVGEEYVDVSSLLANDRRLEQRLLDLLAKRTGKLEEVLSVERELARVRGEMDRYEGRLRFLGSRAAMSTLSVTVHERMPLVAGVGTRNPVALAFGRAWRNFVEFLAGFIAALGIVVPVAALIVAGAFLFRAARRWLRPILP